ncbi:rhomboid family intramembrane serine protease [Synechococcus sp. W4D4]|jgi:membrane associated rhomboid family serine protease|uniref:rhomboid family intramembrane serine protease n=1 Tax=Synechococcus sp. W4D4 TaxID=3392294 RepID=UPI0039ECD377
MGLGTTLGRQLRQWLIQNPEALKSGRAIANRLIDALGAEDGLKGPIRDLANQPLLLHLLHGEGASQASARASLVAHIRQTYSPEVQAELEDLLNAACGQAPPPSAPSSPPSAPKPQAVEGQLRPTLRRLEPLAPGLVLSACGALVLSWFGQELDRLIFDGWGWSGGMVLVLGLASLSIGPWRQPLRHRWSLSSEQATRPREVWRWISAPWVHGNGVEAAVNLTVLLIVLGNSPLPLGQVILRYSLTALACLTLAAICAERWTIQRTWSGSSGAVCALIGLAAGSSLLHWKLLVFRPLGLSIPAWVLLLLVGALQLGWQLPRQQSGEDSTALQRLLASSCSWGLILGLLWALISRLQEWL